MTFDELTCFIDTDMRMSHVYQPVMLMELLRSGGKSSETDIASELLSHDVTQIEYFTKITRNMVGRVLRNRGVVSRDTATKTYTLSGFDQLSRDQVEELTEKCQKRLDDFLQQRGDSVFRHRDKAAGAISGTLRYEILKAAGFRCELCGISADEKALQVDHILPRNHGGSDDLSNLQALCYSCNAMKRDRDDTDFRPIRAQYDHRESGCVFCEMSEDRVIARNELAYAVRDAYPVTEGHSLVITHRHVASFFELTRPETNACLMLLDELKSGFIEGDATVTGFNVGVNDGEDAGQTVFHCHWHLIPRRADDVSEPRGGVRNMIPDQGPY